MRTVVPGGAGFIGSHVTGVSRAARELGWRPEHELADELAETSR